MKINGSNYSFELMYGPCNSDQHTLFFKVIIRKMEEKAYVNPGLYLSIKINNFPE